MDLKYFKNFILGDCYIPKDDFSNIININSQEISIIADDEDIILGAYKTLKISEKDYNKLEKATQNKERKKAITLLKKLHENNKEILSSRIFEIKETPLSSGYYNKQMEDYLKKEPILK